MTRSVAAEVASLPHLPASELIERYRDLFGQEPPISRASWLWRRVAWRLQADAYGGLSEEAKTRLESLVAQFPAPSPAGRPTRPVVGIQRPQSLVAGQVLEKHYKGTTVRVKVFDDGFEHAGVLYPSLTAVARAVTGSRAINGRLFFGLTGRKRGS